MRREELYLADINVEKDDFLHNDLLRSAVLHKLTIIGEAASRLPANFQEQHPEIEWADIVGFRNIAVHSYFSVDWRIVWTTATQDTPMLRDQVVKIVDEQYPPNSEMT